MDEIKTKVGMIIMANIYTLKITYADCDNRIWREAQISENSYLSHLGYMILATFDTLAYHLFSISYGDLIFELPNEDDEVEAEECIFCIQLKDLQLKPGNKLQMIYDFGCDQTFDIEVTNVEPMPRGAGRAYPKILAGEGRGILDDIPACETLKIIKKTDKKGKSDYTYMSGGYHEMIWDYRDYKLGCDNALLKGEIEQIAEGYSYFKQFLEE